MFSLLMRFGLSGESCKFDSIKVVFSDIRKKT
jgi:hypothetical protein